MASIKKSHFSIIRQPLITEKTTLVKKFQNSVVFEVHPRANKREIKDAIEKVFDVKVARVRTLNMVEKKRGARGAKNKTQKAKTWKKAYVVLQKDNSIEVVEGL